MNNERCYVEIDLNVLKSNFNNIKSMSTKKPIGIVKANAYGHGAIEVSKVLIENGVDMLGVATVEEALELRAVFPRIQILILGPIHKTRIADCISNDISIVVSSLDSAHFISEVAGKLHKKAKIHIAVDTGMGRIGFFMQEFDEIVLSEIQSIKNVDNLEVDGIFTHFASADDTDLSFTYKQHEIFKKIIANLVGFNFKYIHCQNSAGYLSLKDDICNAYRIGISLYGYLPSPYMPSNIDIKPCLSWKSTITHIKYVPRNTPIGYGSTYKTNSDSVIATIPTGYADGLRRGLSNNYKFLCKGKLVPIVGNVCMDQTMIDITDIYQNCEVGDTIELISNHNSADVMANALNTISYEILCGISNRVSRVYIDC